MKKVFKFGCLPLLGIFGLIVLYFAFEPESWKNERKNNAQQYVDSVANKMQLVRQSLPILTESSSPQPFPAGGIDWNITLQTSVDEVNHFSDQGFVSNLPILYGPWLAQPMQFIEQAFDTTRIRNDFELIDAGKAIMKNKFLMVYQPLYHLQPKLVDKKTFLPGYFDGWMIYVDFTNGKPLGHARFQSFTTLYKVDTKNLGLGVGPLSIPILNTTDVQEELDKDFRKEFFRKTDSTFLALK